MDINERRKETAAKPKPRSLLRSRMGGSLTVEAALLMPLLVMVLVIFLGLLRFLVGYQTVRGAVYDCADTMADFSDLYELLGLGEIHRGISLGIKEETDTGDTSVDTLLETISDYGQLPSAELEALKPIAQSLIRLLQADSLKQAVAQGVYSLVLNQVGRAIAQAWLRSRLADVSLEGMGIDQGVEGLSLQGSRFLYQENGRDALIRLTVSYRPVLFPGSTALILDPVTITVTVHAFLGSTPFLQSSAENGNEYYRIGQGTKYHSLDCYLIDKKIVSLTLQEARSLGYSSCSRCRSWEENTVWMTSGGEKYHTSGCSYLYPNLQGMTKAEALEQGLTPCELCQGSGGGFQ